MTQYVLMSADGECLSLYSKRTDELVIEPEDPDVVVGDNEYDFIKELMCEQD